MLIPAYADELQSIKTELSRYSHISVFNSALNYLRPEAGQKVFEKMPWIVMFLLKISLLERGGAVQMDGKEFWRITKRVNSLSDKLVGRIPDGTFMLMMRAMLAQQLWYQIQPIDSWRQMFLHRTLFNISHEVNNRLFYDRTGVSLNDYFKIAFYFLTVAGKQQANSVIRYGMTSFYNHLSPYVSDEALANFLKLVAVPFGQLPAYLKPFEVKDSNAAEIYQETPFKNKPIIIEEDGLVIFNAGLCVLGLRSIAIEILKADPDFTTRFGLDFEGYIGERLRLTSAQVYTIPQLNQIIPIKVGKIADYVVTDGSQLVVFESKSIIPNQLMKCAFDPAHLFRLLEENFIKGIAQGQETVDKLARTDAFGGMKARIIIVTLEDFYIYGGDYIGENLDSTFEYSLLEKYGGLPVPMSGVLYMTLKDLIVVTEWLKDKPANAFFNLLDELEAKQNEPGGVRFSFSQHIDERLAAEVFGPVGMHDAVEQSHKEMNDLLQSNMNYWKAQHPVTFMRAYDRFKQRVIRCFV